MGSRWAVPRTRGDQPEPGVLLGCFAVRSPHTRGSTGVAEFLRQSHRPFPAHAGINRDCRPSQSLRSAVPRTRGDQPPRGLTPRPEFDRSPHTRGSTVHYFGYPAPALPFPAHAGINRRRDVCCRHRVTVPRTRGDQPIPSPMTTPGFSGNCGGPHDRPVPDLRRTRADPLAPPMGQRKHPLHALRRKGPIEEDEMKQTEGK